MKANLVWPDGLGSADSEDAVVEGFVTRVLSPGSFFLGNLPVVSNAETVFQGGTEQRHSGWGPIEVHGRLVGGVMTATRVELEDADFRAPSPRCSVQVTLPRERAGTGERRYDL